MAKKLDLKGINLGRTIGIEVEGYTKNYPKLSKGVRHASLKYDASLRNSYGWGVLRDEGRSVGMEVVSVPLSKLDMLDEMFEDIQATRWNIGRGSAGTHVHVDIRDYKLFDQIKMAIFMQKLEDVMFLMVKPNRHTKQGIRNRYCRPLDGSWTKFLERVNNLGIDISRHSDIGSLMYAVTLEERRKGINNFYFPSTTRYNFANVFNTNKGTIEFRLFHAIRTSKDAKIFGLLAYHIIETVKHSTLEQLDFIADSINKLRSAEEMLEKFTTSIGLEVTPKIFNTSLRDKINARKSREVAV